MDSSRASPRTTLPLRAARAGLLLLLATASAGAASAATATISFGEIEAGMRGYGKTVFQGTQVESFDVEILGKISNVAPKRNVILARLSGGPLAKTGVLEGMSGSPIYLDGKLAGAVAYTWGFSKEPICGITPIDEMLEILSREPRKDRAAAPGAGRQRPESLARLGDPAALDAFLLHRLQSLAMTPAPSGLSPIRTPLLFGGGPRRGAAGSALGAFERTFSSLGLSPVRSGGSGDAGGPAGTFEPGSSVAVQLVRGDVEVAGIGTVTYVRGESILAFGHPVLMLGPTALPMTNAVVHGLLPSTATSFKLASSTTPAGAVTQDRFPGLAGSTGTAPPVVPVTVNLASDEEIAKRFEYEIAEDPLLTPVLLHLTLLQILATAEKEVGDITLGVERGSRIRLEGGLDVRIENLYSGEQSELIASGTVAYMTYLLMNNPDRPSRVEGIDLDLHYSDSLRLARIERIWCERYTVAPGETLPLYVVIRPFRGETFTEMIPLEIPEEAPEGKAFLQVGDAVTLSRMEYQTARTSFEPKSLEQLIFLLNRIRTNNRIYATLIRPDTGAIVGGHRLPNLPPSLSTVLLSPQVEEAGAVPVRIRGLLEAERNTPYALRGYQKAVLEIER
jgi:hypothetical protein